MRVADLQLPPHCVRGLEMEGSRSEFRVWGLLVCRFNDEATPSGQFVLRLCAEAESRSLEDLKKAYRDSKVAVLLLLLLFLLVMPLMLLLVLAFLPVALWVEAPVSPAYCCSDVWLRKTPKSFSAAKT